MKVRLFTHTDLDGSGCVIDCFEAFGRENVKWSAHSYMDIDDALESEVINNPAVFQQYDMVIIADISPDQPTAYLLDSLSSEGKLWQFDHHKTRAWATRFSWVVYDEGICAAKILYHWLIQEGYLDVSLCKENGLEDFINATNAYDLWLLSDPMRSLGESLTRMNNVLGQRVFLSLDRDEVIELESKMHQALVDKENTIISKSVAKSLLMTDEHGNPFAATISTGLGPMIAHSMLRHWGKAKYAAVFNPFSGTASLYSRVGQGFDVSSLAQERHPNGGGHAAAAGYELQSGLFEKLIRVMLVGLGNEIAPE